MSPGTESQRAALFCTAKAHPFYADNGHFRHEEVCCSRLRSGFFTVYIENATFAMILTKIHMENKKYVVE